MKRKVVLSSEEAKRFFIQKIIEQAGRDGVALSEIEKNMLEFSSEREADFLKLNEEFERRYDSDEYEAKIANLLQRAFEQDVAAVGLNERDRVKAQYAEAYTILRQQDHYLAVMIDQCLFGREEAGWKVAASKLLPWILLTIGVIVGVLVVVTSVLYRK